MSPADPDDATPPPGWRDPLEGQELQIDYPTRWSYTLIGTDPVALHAAVVEVVGELPFELTPSKRSATGKYVSLNLELVVVDEAQRLAIGEGLNGHPAVRFVL